MTDINFEGQGSCTITCQEPGCSNKIRYVKGETEVPLYCRSHRTDEGRHAATKDMSGPKPEPEPKPKMVIMRCPICKDREKAKESVMWGGVAPECCGARMLYHRDAKEGE